jgi:hypothetical protein
MPVRRKTKTQYVEHSEEHVGAEMKPFVALLPATENQVEKQPTATPDYTGNTAAMGQKKRKTPFWRKVAAFFG